MKINKIYFIILMIIVFNIIKTSDANEQKPNNITNLFHNWLLGAIAKVNWFKVNNEAMLNNDEKQKIEFSKQFLAWGWALLELQNISFMEERLQEERLQEEILQKSFDDPQVISWIEKISEKNCEKHEVISFMKEILQKPFDDPLVISFMEKILKKSSDDNKNNEK